MSSKGFAAHAQSAGDRSMNNYGSSGGSYGSGGAGNNNGYGFGGKTSGNGNGGVNKN